MSGSKVTSGYWQLACGWRLHISGMMNLRNRWIQTWCTQQVNKDMMHTTNINCVAQSLFVKLKTVFELWPRHFCSSARRCLWYLKVTLFIEKVKAERKTVHGVQWITSKSCLTPVDVDCYHGTVVTVCDGHLGLLGYDYLSDVMTLCYGIAFLLLWFKRCLNK